MILSIDKLISNYKLNVKGVIHIGAHYGEEYKSYLENGIKNIFFFEPLKDNYAHLIDTIRSDFQPIDGYPQDLDLINSDLNLHVKTKNIALGNKTGTIQMYVETTNQSQSSSILKPKKHLTQYPKITFDSKSDVIIDKLDNVSPDSSYNMINIDVQGYELEVFKGAELTIANNIDYIYTEVNRDMLYEGCPMIEQLDEFLCKYGFERVITKWIGKTWGDALYIKSKYAPGKFRQTLIRFKYSKAVRKLLKAFGKR